MRRFSLYCRNSIFYARFWNPLTKTYAGAKSTGEQNEKKARAVVDHWEQHGFDDGSTIDDLLDIHTMLHLVRHAPLTDDHVQTIMDTLKERGLIASAVLKSNTIESQPLLPFLERFWDFDQSEYVAEKHDYGQSIGRRRCYEQQSRLRAWREVLPDKLIGEVTRDDLRDFQKALKAKGLANKTINMTLEAGTIAFNWLHDRGDLESNPASNLKKFSGNPKKRGILSEREAQQIFRMDWTDDRARVGNLVGMTTGLRLGEIVALRREDIGEDRLHVRHSWSFADGLKAPKNGEVRTAPLLPAVREELLKLADSNPHGEGFIFYQVDPDRPCDGEVLRKGLIRVLVDMTLPEADRDDPKKRKAARDHWVKERAICFHSWRHFFATHLADRVELRSVQLATGHKSAQMAELYAAHAQDEHFKGVSDAVKQAFGDVIPFHAPHECSAG